MGRDIRVVAVDLGATSGRAMVGTVGGERLELEEVHRFAHRAVPSSDGLRWDASAIYHEVLTGIQAATRGGPVDGIGIDSWAVDHGLLDESGELVGNAYSHRDSRTEGVAEQVAKVVPRSEQYEITGVAALPFNTVYQLVAARGCPELSVARVLLLLPDLLGYWLTGAVGAERTNASTTGSSTCAPGRGPPTCWSDWTCRSASCRRSARRVSRSVPCCRPSPSRPDSHAHR